MSAASTSMSPDELVRMDLYRNGAARKVASVALALAVHAAAVAIVATRGVTMIELSPAPILVDIVEAARRTEGPGVMSPELSVAHSPASGGLGASPPVVEVREPKLPVERRAEPPVQREAAPPAARESEPIAVARPKAAPTATTHAGPSPPGDTGIAKASPDSSAPIGSPSGSAPVSSAPQWAPAARIAMRNCCSRGSTGTSNTR